MGAYVKFVKPEHEDILLNYLADEGVVLVFPKAQQAVKDLGIQDHELVADYDFGGECDTWLDKVYNEKHLFIQERQEAEEDEPRD